MAINPTQFFEKDEPRSSFDVQSMIKGHKTTRDSNFTDWKTVPEGPKELHKQLGANFAKFKDGKRIPDIKQAANPMLKSPSVLAQKFFGQSALPKVAMDQILAKPIGVFTAEAGGAGAGAMGMMMNMGEGGLFNGMQSLQDIVGKTLLGGAASKITEAHQNFAKIQSMAQQMGQFIGADLETMIDLRAPDEMMKVMQGAAFVFAGGQQVFDGSVFSDGVDFANDVGSYLSKTHGVQLPQIPKLPSFSTSFVPQIPQIPQLPQLPEIPALDIDINVSLPGVSLEVSFSFGS